ALGAHLPSDARHLARERVELVDHRVDDLAGPPKLSAQRPPLELEVHALGEVAFRDSSQHSANLDGGLSEVGDELVDRHAVAAPGAARGTDRRALSESTVAANDAADAAQLGRRELVQFNDVVEGFGDLAAYPAPALGQPDGEVASTHGAKRLEESLLVEHLRRLGRLRGHEASLRMKDTSGPSQR